MLLQPIQRTPRRSGSVGTSKVVSNESSSLPPTPRSGGRRANALQQISLNIRSPARKTPIKVHNFESPGRRQHSSSIKASPYLLRRQQCKILNDPDDMLVDTAVDSSDEDEVFFGAVSHAEMERAARLRKRRRRTMLDHAEQHLGLEHIPRKRADYAARVIQAFFKMVKFRAFFERRRVAAICIQAAYRGYLARQKVLAMHGAANVIQTWWRRVSKSGPRSPPMLPGETEKFDVEPPTQELVVVPMKPLQGASIARSAVQAKIERLKQLREKRQQLEMKLWRNGTSDASGQDHAALNLQARRDVRSTLIGLSTGTTAVQQPITTDNLGSIPPLSLCRIPMRLRTNGNGRRPTCTNTQDQDLDRLTRLNTARNSGPAIDRPTFLSTIMKAVDSDQSPIVPRTTRVRWRETLTSCSPYKSAGVKCKERRQSILKFSAIVENTSSASLARKVLAATNSSVTGTEL